MSLHPNCVDRGIHNWDNWELWTKDHGEYLADDTGTFCWRRICQNMGCDAVEYTARLEPAGERKIVEEDVDPTMRQRTMDRKIVASLDREREIEKYLRLELWSGHGCARSAMYGDDGEMQCGECLTDFKRKPIGDLIAVVQRRRMSDKMSLDDESTVAGKRMERSIGDFVRACETHINEIARSPIGDTSTLALLCDAVRLARELTAMTAPQTIDQQLVQAVIDVKDAALKAGIKALCAWGPGGSDRFVVEAMREALNENLSD